MYTDEQGAVVTPIVAWLALILSILAFSLAWVAFNRTGTDLENRIQQGIEQGMQGVQEGADEAEDNLDNQDQASPTNDTTDTTNQ